ncbi:heme exporter protein CcmD [Sulfitobacter sp. EhC04]|uniref:heme exporter protein CcmD n=1 Tax=Sulfitobacter sp. EhC04 TaxID=1849168 RepID=UPI0007F51267|nr:heme exporter protein CcmD [Sulfitobacter sp. EhC04]OAN78334.1 heme exporter protein CcmD [Sulfitobacter sp. EhC04]
MMPELGKYATEVLSAYAVSLLLLAVLVLWTLRRGRAARATLEAAERETGRHD